MKAIEQYLIYVVLFITGVTMRYKVVITFIFDN